MNSQQVFIDLCLFEARKTLQEYTQLENALINTLKALRQKRTTDI